MRRRPRLTEEKYDREAQRIKENVRAKVDADALVSDAEKARRKKARESLLAFTRYTFGNCNVGWHHRAVCRYLDQFALGIIPRLMLFMPPRHGKSELGSRRLPAYIFGRNPDAQIIGTSYAADLAQRMNRDVQRIMGTQAYRDLFPQARLGGSNVRSNAQGSYLRNSDIFEIVGRKGSYRAAGVGGGITGMGADIAIIDDPVKSRKEANSPTVRKAVWEWYTSTLYTRLEKDGRILLILTRWHEDDLAGRLIKQAKEDTGADQWTVVNYPAILREGMPRDRFDRRKIGEALWPWKYNAEKLKKTRQTIGTYDWASLYEGNPKPLDGGLIDLSWFADCRYSVLPTEFERIVQSWDTAQKAKDTNDYSVCTTWGVTGNRLYLMDIDRRRLEFPELERAVVANYHRHNADAVLIEDKASGISLIQALRKNTLLPVIPVLPDADKETRMMVETPKMESGRVWLPLKSPWLDDLEEELAAFPNGAFDDQADSISQFLAWIGNKIPAAYGNADPSPPRRLMDDLRDDHAPEDEDNTPSGNLFQRGLSGMRKMIRIRQ